MLRDGQGAAGRAFLVQLWCRFGATLVQVWGNFKMAISACFLVKFANFAWSLVQVAEKTFQFLLRCYWGAWGRWVGKVRAGSCRMGRR
jgi:hypothetical protein